MTDTGEDSARRKEAESELDAMLAGLSGPLTPVGRSERPASAGQDASAPLKSESEDRKRPRHSVAASSKAGNGGTVDPSGAPFRHGELPDEVEALSDTYHATLFPTGGEHAPTASTDGNRPSAPAKRAAMPMILVGALLCLAVLLGAGFLAYRDTVDQQLTIMRQRSDELQRQLDTGHKDVVAIQDVIGRLQREQASATRSVQRLRQEIGAMRSEVADRIQGLAGRIEQLHHLAVQREQTRNSVDSTMASVPGSLLATAPDEHGLPVPATAVDESAAGIGQTPAVTVADPQEGSPQATPDTAPTSSWALNLVSHRSRSKAMALAEQLNDSDIAAVVSEAEVSGKRWYRVRVTGFPNANAAEAFRRRHLQQPAFGGAWIAKGR